MFCENCEIEHDGSYGSGRFCSFKCARGFSTKSKRNEINQKVSNKLKGNFVPWNKNKTLDIEYLYKSKSEKFLTPEKVLIKDSEYKGSIAKYVILKFRLKQNICEKCETEKWFNLPIFLEAHHKNKDTRDNRIENIELLCSNCHTFVHHGLISQLAEETVREAVKCQFESD